MDAAPRTGGGLVAATLTVLGAAAAGDGPVPAVSGPHVVVLPMVLGLFAPTHTA